MNPDRSYFGKMFKPEVFNLTPDNCDNDEEFVELVTEETWNLDEWTPEGIMMLKHFVFKTVTKDVPEKHDIDIDYLLILIKEHWDKIK